MKRSYVTTPVLFIFLGLLAGACYPPAALAQDEATQSESKSTTLSEISLPNQKVTDLFVRSNQTSLSVLYVAYLDNTLSLIDVTDPKNPKVAHQLRLSAGSTPLKLRPVSPNIIVATGAPDSSQQLTVITGNASPVVAKQFSKVDAYTVDSGRNLVFVVDKGKLSIVKFEGPVSKAAQIFEENSKAH